jgi:hypothetical protein
VLGDVCGKGVEAAAVTGMTRWILRGAAQSGADPVAALEILNRELLRHSGDRYCTVALGHVRPRPGGAEIGLVCAGHPPPLLRRNDGTVRELYEPGTLLGIYEDIDLPTLSVRLHAGDGLLFYTDGLLEARRAVGQPDDPPLEALSECGRASSSDVVTYIERATGVLDVGRLRDDVALLALWASAPDPGGPESASGESGSAEPRTVAADSLERRERVGHNEGRFRQLNERIEAGHPLPEERISFLCECGRLDCTAHVQVSRSEYERVRADSRLFLIVPGHEISETETVVANEPGWAVVKKHADVAPIAEQTDPRRE